MARDVDQHAAPLNRTRGKSINAEWHGESDRSLFRRKDISLCDIAVVKAQLRLSVAVDIELVADVGEAVPLRRVLRAKGHRIIAAHVGEMRALVAEAVVEERASAPLRRPQHGWVAVWC